MSEPALPGLVPEPPAAELTAAEVVDPAGELATAPGDWLVVAPEAVSGAAIATAGSARMSKLTEPAATLTSETVVEDAAGT